ncbi:MAG: hypothetical protein ACLQBA_24630 [Candidatus Binataceae bacterium]
MRTLYAVGLIVGFGMVGGFFNALLTEQGLTLPGIDRNPGGHRILRLGFFGNVVTGGITAIVLAGLYSPLGAVEIDAAQPVNLHLTLASLAGALLSGVGGARLLTQEVDKRYNELTEKNLASAAKTVTDNGR